MIDTSVTLADLNSRSRGNMGETLGIEFVEINSQYLKARMPVDERTIQPLGLLNGGASAALAETVGSMAAYLSIDRSQYYCLGLEIKCNHLRSVSSGWVTGMAKPIHLGKSTHVWQIENIDDEGRLVSFITLTMAVMELNGAMKDKFKDLFFKS